jgi:hypothetical protein
MSLVTRCGPILSTNDAPTGTRLPPAGSITHGQNDPEPRRTADHPAGRWAGAASRNPGRGAGDVGDGSKAWGDHAGLVGPHVMRTSRRTSARARSGLVGCFPP